MSDLHPITCPDLLEEADAALYAQELVDRLTGDLAARGLNPVESMIAVAGIADYFRRLRMVPRPESALSIFLGLEGEAALDRIVASTYAD